MRPRDFLRFPCAAQHDPGRAQREPGEVVRCRHGIVRNSEHCTVLDQRCTASQVGCFRLATLTQEVPEVGSTRLPVRCNASGTRGLRRRTFITLLGGAAVAWPLAARAQQPAMPVIGFVHSAVPDAMAHLAVGFRQGLTEAGFVESRNVIVEYRWAENHIDRLPGLVADLVGRRVTVIAATGHPACALAAKAATATIPIVFTNAADPVKLGLVASLNRPGSNVTGVTNISSELGAKRLGLLRELMPLTTLIAVLLNPNNPSTESQLRQLQEASRGLGIKLHVVEATAESDFDAAFASIAAQRAGALLVGGDALFNSRRDQLVAMSMRHAVPAIYEFREFAAAGGLMSYGTSIVDVYRQVGVYVGRILKGATPADLPVIQPTKFDFVMNLRTAKALGLDVPLHLQQLADEVIE